MLFEPAAEPFVGDPLHHRADFGVAEFGLGLAFELWFGEADRHDRSETLAHVVALERRVLPLEEVAVLRVPVDRVRERPFEPFGVHSAFGRRDAVGVGVEPFVVAGVPLPRDVDFAFGFARAERADVLEERFLALVEVADEIGDTAVEAEGHLLLVADPFVTERDRESTVQERGHLESFEHGRGAELGLFEHVGVGPERDRGAGGASGLAGDPQRAARNPMQRCMKAFQLLSKRIKKFKISKERKQTSITPMFLNTICQRNKMCIRKWKH